MNREPTATFIAVSWIALGAGMLAYLVGLFNAGISLNLKTNMFTLLMFGLFAVVSVQKAVRDREEGIPVTQTYYLIAWVATILSILLLAVSVWTAPLALSEKGFYLMAFLLSLFAAITVQKNTRDKEIHSSAKAPRIADAQGE